MQLELSEQELDIILRSLGKQPAEISMNVIIVLDKQITANRDGTWGEKYGPSGPQQ